MNNHFTGGQQKIMMNRRKQEPADKKDRPTVGPMDKWINGQTDRKPTRKR